MPSQAIPRNVAVGLAIGGAIALATLLRILPALRAPRSGGRRSVDG